MRLARGASTGAASHGCSDDQSVQQKAGPSGWRHVDGGEEGVVK